ncbi:hypothetical protein ACH5RR_031482 [Cinchona calisaya]|uniref:C2H2-type domain-containing protein n=1 Tax=Cinchona calisaya TaxID=153742 RepID=A0ABD2YIU2_9GENT
MGIQYFWHDHPLEPRSVLSDSKAHCYVCQKPVSGYNYKCPKCNFFLHISCLKLPLESLHPLHQDHPLTLLNQLPLDVSNNHEIPCNKCKNPCSGFTYHCESCSFNLHIQCSIEEYSLNLEVHKQHPLTFSAWPPNGFESFLCNMCGECGFGFCFFCKICQFVIHVECSLLPSKVKYGYYQRTCNLIRVQSIEDGTGEFYCSICEKRVNEKGSIYYCADSEYIGHLGCMVSISELRFKPAYKDIAVSSSDLFDAQKYHDNTFDNRLEMQLGKDEDEELSKMRQRFRELLTGKDKPVSYTMSHELEQNFKKLDHFSHEHPLVLDDDYQNNGHMCHACWLPISRFPYGCTKCNFFLHKWCAELPLKIQHPVHNQHSLSLLSSNPHCGGCDACGHTLEGFTYTCKSCYFNLHSICASVPRIIRNEIHQHPLILCRKKLYSSKCSCCKEDCIGIVFECEMCNLVLDFKCALLPHKIKHDCHIDPLVLTSLVEDEEDEYYCNACEERRQPNHWVYYCAGCEFSAHLICVVSELVGGFPKEAMLMGFEEKGVGGSSSNMA